MLMRAVFWVGFVAVLAPHGPLSGYDRPQSTEARGVIKDWVGVAATMPAATTVESTPASSLFDRLQLSAVKSIDGLTAAIGEHERSSAQ